MTRVMCVKAERPIVWRRLWSLSVFPCQLFQLVFVNYCQLSVNDGSEKASQSPHACALRTRKGETTDSSLWMKIKYDQICVVLKTLLQCI